MDPAHVVVEIPPSREAIARDGALAGGEEAQVGVLAVTVHSVGFSLVTEEAGVRGEVNIDTLGDLAMVGLEVGVEVFTGKS